MIGWGSMSNSSLPRLGVDLEKTFLSIAYLNKLFAAVSLRTGRRTLAQAQLSPLNFFHGTKSWGSQKTMLAMMGRFQ